MFQHSAVLRLAISGCKINALCVLTAASFWWLHGRHGAGVLGAGSLPPVPATAAPMEDLHAAGTLAPVAGSNAGLAAKNNTEPIGIGKSAQLRYPGHFR